MHKYKLIIGYDGTSYCGWQKQKGEISIQSLVEKALQTLLRHKVACISASRTDAGVHAKGQVAHFTSPQLLTPYRLGYSLNALLPPSIRIFETTVVPMEFHARYSAQSKIYHYHLHLNPILDPLLRFYRYRPYEKINLSAMQKALPYFVGTHDFFTFANEGSRGSAARNSIRTLKRLDLIEQEGGVRLEFEGNGFLYKMVRNITGTLLDVGKGKLAPEKIPSLFTKRHRKAIGMAAPPQGLFLMQIKYPMLAAKAHSP